MDGISNYSFYALSFQNPIMPQLSRGVGWAKSLWGGILRQAHLAVWRSSTLRNMPPSTDAYSSPYRHAPAYDGVVFVKMVFGFRAAADDNTLPE